MAEMFSPYQIDFDVKNTSKTFGFSKKKVTFKFGVANNQALADGMTGANCRGSEHEVIFTWSLNTGKRQILADGKDVHYSETGQNGWTADQVFQHHFNIRVPGLSAPLRAHLITQPANRDVPQIKPFDLRICGVSYFGMPKIFQLGTPQMVSRPVQRSGKNRGGGGRDDEAYMTPEERKAVAAAKLASLRDLQQPPPAPAPAASEDLINFFDDPTPAPPPPQTAAAAGGSGYYGAPPPGQGPPPAAMYAQQSYSNYSLGGSFPPEAPPPPPQQQSFSSMPSAYASSSSFGSMPPPAAAPVPFGQPSALAGYPPQQASMAPTGYPPQHAPQQAYGYQQQAPPPMQYQSQSSFGSLPNNIAQPSPSNQTIGSYQSYGSAPTFAQPPQQQQAPPPPQQQQYPQYGAPPPQQGYPRY